MKAFSDIVKNFHYNHCDPFGGWQYITVGNMIIEIKSNKWTSIYLFKYYTDHQKLLTYRNGYQVFFKTIKSESYIEWEEMDELLENDLERAAISVVTSKTNNKGKRNASL